MLDQPEVGLETEYYVVWAVTVVLKALYLELDHID